MPYIGNVLTSFAVETGNINDQAVTAPKLSATGGTDGQVLALDSNLNLEWVSDPAGQWVTSGTDLTYTAGNVGIGTSSPANILHLASTGTPTIQITDEDNSGIVKIENGSGSLFLNADTGNTVSNSRIQFGIDGSEQMRIDSSGNVGIGATAPAAKLDVAGNQIFTGANPQIQFNAGGPIIRLPSANTLAFLTDSTNERMRIDSSGQVGIGTTSPDEDLHVFSSAGAIKIDGSGDTALRFATSGTNKFSIFQSSDTLRFFDNSNSAERMRIDSSGRVGIGTDSPGGFSSGANTLVVGTASGNAGITINNGAADQIGSIFFAEGTGASAVGRIRYEHANNAMAFSTINDERMRIDSSGRLLVGVSSTVSVAGSSSFIQHHGNKTTSNLALVGYNNNLGGPILSFGSSRSTTVGTPGTAVSSGDFLGDIRFAGDDGTDINTTAAAIRGEVDGTPGSNDVPGRLVFTTAASGSSATERMRITSSGEIRVPAGIGTQLRFENQHSSTADAAISTFDDGVGTLLCFGSNFFFSAAGAETRYNTGEESAAVVVNRTGNISFLTNGTSATATERMRINSAGRVGIGNSDPQSTLDVSGDIRVSSGQAILSNSSGGTLQLQGGATFPGGNILLGGGSGNNDIRFRNTGSSSTQTERMRIDSSGRLLINTTNGVELIYGVGGGLKLARNKTGNPTSGQSLMSIGFHGVDDTNSNSTAEAKIEAFAAENHSGTTAASQLRFYTKSSGTGPGSSATERLRIQADGTIQLRNSPGIDFSQIQTNATGVANETLDSYEEGTWTPVPNFGGGTTGITYATAPTGNYTKIGNLVFVVMGFQFSNKGSSTGSFVVSGLPFTVASTASFKHPNSVVNAHNMTNADKIYAALGAGSAINYRRISDSNTDSVPGDGDFQNNSGFYHSLVYVT